MASVLPRAPARAVPRQLPEGPSPVVSRFHKPRISWAAIGFVLACFVSAARAAAPITAAPVPLPTETLLLDTRSLVMEQGHWTMLSHEEQGAHELRRRASASGSVTTSFEVAVSTVTERSSAASSSVSSTTSLDVPPSPLPSPFDMSMGSNFTGNDGNGACPAFINSFLTSPTFKECYPFSLLMQGSRSFFNAGKSLVSITQVLDATCAANATFCTGYLSSLAANLTEQSNCGADYQLGNSIVVQAYLGMVAYPTVYSATCLQDPETSSYCFGNAVTNYTTPSNVYIYYLPLNISLPGSSIPSCNWCLQQTMAVFQASSANRKLPVAYTYQSAAQQVDTICGPGFVNDTLPIAIISNAAPGSITAPGAFWLAFSVLFGVAMHLLL